MFNAVKFVQRFDAYFHAVGCFMHEFAQMETVMKAFYCSGVFTGEPAIEFGSQKLNLVPTLTKIEDVRRKKGLPESAYLTRAFEQVRKLAATRNVLIHNGAHFREHLTFISDPIKEAAGDNPAEQLDVGVLSAMCQDLSTIQACIMAHLLDQIPEELTYQKMIYDLGISRWHRDMMTATGMDDRLREIDIRAEIKNMAIRPWAFEPKVVKETGQSPDIMRRKPGQFRRRKAA